MTDARVNLVNAGPAGLPGLPTIAGVRRLLVWVLGAGILYSFFTTASKGTCTGGFTGDGGFVDGAGNLTDTAPACVNLTLQPSGLVYAALGFVVLLTLSTVLRKADTELAAMRLLDRAVIVVAGIAVVSVLVSQVWFWFIPLPDGNEIGTLLYPWPFATIDVVTTPMTG